MMNREEKLLAYQQVMLTKRLITQVNELNDNLATLIKDNRQRQDKREKRYQNATHHSGEFRLGSEISVWRSRLTDDIKGHDTARVARDFKVLLTILEARPDIDKSITVRCDKAYTIYERARKAYYDGKIKLALQDLKKATTVELMGRDRAEQRQSIIDNAKQRLLGDKIAKLNDRLVTDISNHDTLHVSHDFKDVSSILKSHPGIKTSIIADYRKSQEAYHKGNADLALRYIYREARETGC